MCIRDSYITGRGGVLKCYSAETGDLVYKTRVEGMKSGASSYWADKDKIFILDEEGQTFIVQTGAEFKLLGSNKVDGLFWSTPSASGKSLLVRSADKLFSIRE